MSSLRFIQPWCSRAVASNIPALRFGGVFSSRTCTQVHVAKLENLTTIPKQNFSDTFQYNWMRYKRKLPNLFTSLFVLGSAGSAVYMWDKWRTARAEVLDTRLALLNMEKRMHHKERELQDLIQLQERTRLGSKQQLVHFPCGQSVPYINFGMHKKTCEKAPRKVALVIGNGYANNSNAGELAKTRQDAVDVAATLRDKCGYELIGGGAQLDVNGQQLANLLQQLQETIQVLPDSNVQTVFYFAGHGYEWQGQNYLVPQDGLLPQDAPTASSLLQPRNKSSSSSASASSVVSLENVIQMLDNSASKFNLLIVDACRSLPNSPSPSSSSVPHPIEPTDIGQFVGQKEGSIVCLTSVGSPSLVGTIEDKNSFFVRALLPQLASTDDTSTVLKRVCKEVYSSSQGQQRPFILDSSLKERSLLD